MVEPCDIKECDAHVGCHLHLVITSRSLPVVSLRCYVRRHRIQRTVCVYVCTIVHWMRWLIS